MCKKKTYKYTLIHYGSTTTTKKKKYARNTNGRYTLRNKIFMPFYFFFKFIYL